MDYNSLPHHDRVFLNRLAATDSAGEMTGREDMPAMDEMVLAAWLEGQFDEEEAVPIEWALLDDPELLEDLAALRLGTRQHPVADPALIARACALVPGDDVVGAEVVPFVRPTSSKPRPLSVWLSWGAVAASVAIVSLVGFNLGSIVGKNEVVSSGSSDLVVVLNDDLD